MTSLLKRMFSSKRPYEVEIRRLEKAIASRTLDENQRMQDCRVDVEKAIGWHSVWDGGDWVELDMQARELKLIVTTVKDFLNLLRAINRERRR